MTISLSKGLIATHSTNHVFDDNSAFGESRVVEHVIGGTRLPAWFATRRSTCAELINAYIGQIPNATDSIRQTVHQGRLLQQGYVGGGSRDTLGDIHDAPRFFIYSHLAFEGMGLFLTRIQTVGLGFVARTLNFLLKAVNHHRQLGCIPQQVIQLTPTFPTWIGQAHGVSTC